VRSSRLREAPIEDARPLAQRDALAGFGLNSGGVSRASDYQIRDKRDHLLDALVAVVPKINPKVEVVGAELHQRITEQKGNTVNAPAPRRAGRATNWLGGGLCPDAKPDRQSGGSHHSIILVLSPEPAQSASSCRDQYNICRVRCPTMNSGCPLRCQTRLKRCKVPTPDLANLLPYSRSNLQR